MSRDIEVVSRAFLDELFDSEGDKYEPAGRFLCRDEAAGRMIYVAVDNTTGEAFTEEFATRNMATRWLHGKAATNIHGERLER